MSTNISRFIVGISCGLVLAGLIFSNQVYSDMVQSGVIVPLYASPGAFWDNLVSEKQAHPAVPVIAIVNPKNGSGNSLDQPTLSGIQKLQSAGITVLGYVYTSYGTRNSSAIQSEIGNYKAWYNTNGIFFDEMSNTAGHEQYYYNLTSYAKSRGMSYTVGNPGLDTLLSYIGTVDTIVIYDNNGSATPSYLSGWHTGYDKKNFAVMSYGVNSFNQSSVGMQTNFVGYLYITSNDSPNPWDSGSPYLDNMFSMSAPVSVNIESRDLLQNKINGLYTTFQTSGVIIKTGFTPFSYILYPGLQYTVTAADYQNYIFDHWDDGSKNRFRTITPTQTVTLTAYYSTGSTITAPRPPTALTATTISSSQINLSWTAPSSNGGSAITGYKIEGSTNGGATWSAIVSNSGSTGTTYSNTGLAANTTYSYRVSAINSVGTGAPSNTASASTLSSGTGQQPIIYMHDTTASYGLSTYSGRQIQSEYVNSSSVLVGKQIDTIILKLKKVGSPTGNATIGVFNSDLSVRKVFATINVTRLATSYTDYTFSLPSSSQPYQIQSQDRIGIKFAGGNSTFYVAIMTDQTGIFDGTNSYLTYYMNTWKTLSTKDLYMTLERIH